MKGQDVERTSLQQVPSVMWITNLIRYLIGVSPKLVIYWSIQTETCYTCTVYIDQLKLVWIKGGLWGDNE